MRRGALNLETWGQYMYQQHPFLAFGGFMGMSKLYLYTITPEASGSPAVVHKQFTPRLLAARALKIKISIFTIPLHVSPGVVQEG